MSEQFKPSIESSPEVSSTPEHSEKPKTKEAESTTPERDYLAESLNSIRNTVENQAVSTKETPVAKTEQSNNQPMSLQRELKADAYKHTLEKARTRLSKPAQTFSKIAHQPTIDTVSTVVAKTIARQSGMFVGGLTTLIGSSILLYMTKHFGFTYNYAVFILCFVGGYIVGITLEAIWRLLFRRQRRYENI